MAGVLIVGVLFLFAFVFPLVFALYAVAFQSIIAFAVVATFTVMAIVLRKALSWFLHGHSGP